jgi:hypothetical protein
MSGRSKEPLHRYRREDIEDMVSRLVGLGFGHTWAAEESRNVLALIDDANLRIEQLEKAWSAVERCHSGDYSLNVVDEIIAASEPPERRPPPV